MKLTRKRRVSKKVKKALTAYNLFFQDERQKTLNGSKGPVQDHVGFVRSIGAQWKNLDTHTRCLYEVRAKQLRDGESGRTSSMLGGQSPSTTNFAHERSPSPYYPSACYQGKHLTATTNMLDIQRSANRIDQQEPQYHQPRTIHGCPPQEASSTNIVHQGGNLCKPSSYYPGARCEGNHLAATNKMLDIQEGSSTNPPVHRYSGIILNECFPGRISHSSQHRSSFIPLKPQESFGSLGEDEDQSTTSTQVGRPWDSPPDVNKINCVTPPSENQEDEWNEETGYTELLTTSSYKSTHTRNDDSFAQKRIFKFIGQSRSFLDDDLCSFMLSLQFSGAQPV